MAQSPRAGVTAWLLVALAAASADAQLFSGGGGQPSITLRYFDIRGLAEPVRLTLAALGLEYEEVVYQRCPTNSLGAAECPPGVTDWNSAKQEGIESGLLPFGQVPSMTYKDHESGKTFEMVQSQAILRFLAKRHGFYGTSEDEEILIDVAVGGVGDMRSAYSDFAYDPASVADESVRAKYVGEYLPKWLGYFEKLLRRAGGQYFGGSAFSFADVLVFDILDHNLRVDPACLAKLPTLQQFVGAIGHKHGIWEYVSDPSRRRAFSNGANAAYDTPNHSPHGNGFAPPPKETQKSEL